MKQLDYRSAQTRIVRMALEWNPFSLDGADVIGAAVDALLVGFDSPALRELAGMSAREDTRDISAMLSRSLEQLSIAVPPAGTDEAFRLLLGFRCADYLAGRGSARTMARWAYSCFGYMPEEPLRSLALLDDAMDEDDRYETSAAGVAYASKLARDWLMVLHRPDLFS